MSGYSIKELREFKDNWDGYQGAAPTTEALIASEQLATFLDELDVKYEMYPVRDGSIEFEIQGNELDLEVYGEEGKYADWIWTRSKGKASVTLENKETLHGWARHEFDPDYDHWMETDKTLAGEPQWGQEVFPDD